MWSRERSWTLFRLVLLAAAIATQLWSQCPAATAETETARVIVKFKADSALASARSLSATTAAAYRAAALGARLGLPTRAGATVSDHAQVVFATGLTSAELAQLLARESDVEFAVPDERRRIVAAPNDPLYTAGPPASGPAAGQWYLHAPSGDVQS